MSTNLSEHTTVHRRKRRIEDTDLHTTRIVGAGWWWECTCGEKGSWGSTRDDAMRAARLHQLEEHGGEDAA